MSFEISSEEDCSAAGYGVFRWLWLPVVPDDFVSWEAPAFGWMQLGLSQQDDVHGVAFQEFQ
jgi:hypothetical protein